MSYELGKNEGLGDGIRRICRKQIELALQIASGEKEAKDTPVHETRKHLKKARAALRLVKKEIGRGLFQRHNHALRDVGRLISEIRDAEVRLQTVRQLQGIKQRPKRRSYRKVEETLMLELENFIAAFAEWQTQAVAMLEKVRDEMTSWSVDQFDCKQLRRAVQRSYRSARRALGEAKTTGAAKDFHEFRTKAKFLWHQLRILSPVNPVVLRNLADELKAVGNLLGRAHDLSFLGDRLSRGHGREFKREGHELLALIEASGSDLQRAAAELADHFFAERPRDFGGRLSTWLEDWPSHEKSSVAQELIEDPAPASLVV